MTRAERAAERRAALAAARGEPAPPPFVTPAVFVDREELKARYARPEESEDDIEDPEPMKIRYQSVTLHKAAPRHDGGRNRASTETTFFDINKQPGIVLELDTSTRQLRISKGAQACYIPEHGVERFGPTLEDVAAIKAEQEAADEKSRQDNARAAAEAQRIANQPRV